jgi:RNA polymerase sigma factor (sigma-70 family)
MTDDLATVFVVDDDPSIQRGLKTLIRSVGLRVEVFGSAHDFLQSKRTDGPGCLVLDVRLPGMSGLEFQKELVKANVRVPIIFITAHGDVPMSVRAMKAGALEFLTKPFRDQDLLDAIQTALERDRINRQQEIEIAELRERFKSLTAREQELMRLVLSGRLNKQIADEIGTSENTVKVHRSNMMRKMRAESLVDLMKIANQLGILETSP